MEKNDSQRETLDRQPARSSMSEHRLSNVFAGSGEVPEGLPNPGRAPWCPPGYLEGRILVECEYMICSQLWHFLRKIPSEVRIIL